jgi:hypothetical protein
MHAGYALDETQLQVEHLAGILIGIIYRTIPLQQSKTSADKLVIFQDQSTT